MSSSVVRIGSGEDRSILIALQVEPDRFKRKDTALLDFKEALHIEKIRNTVFIRLYELLENTQER
jgi:hypothetical protein